MANSMPESDDPELKFYSTSQVASLMEVSPQTVRNWIKTDKLKATMLGKRVRIRKSDLLDFTNALYGDSDGK